MGILRIIMIIGFYQTIILSGVIWMKKEKSISDFFLSVLFLVYGMTLLMGFLEIYNRENNYPFPYILNASTPFIFLHGPLLWFYIKSLTTRNFRFKWKYLLHFVPFTAVLFQLTMEFYRLPLEIRIETDRNEVFRDQLSYPVVIAMVAIFTQGYFFWGLSLISKYRKRIQNYFSEVTRLDLAWLKVLLITCIIFYAGNSILYLADYLFKLMSYQLLQSIGYAYASVFILVLGLKGYQQGKVFSRKSVAKDMDNLMMIDPETSITDDPDSEFVKELLQFMEKSKPHTNPEINLANLASMLHVQPEYLSSVINGKLNKNFFDFINHFRINEFKELCKKNSAKNLTIMGIAWDAGFNSKATFNRVFKKSTGLTPGEYIQSIQSTHT